MCTDKMTTLVTMALPVRQWSRDMQEKKSELYVIVGNINLWP